MQIVLYWLMDVQSDIQYCFYYYLPEDNSFQWLIICQREKKGIVTNNISFVSVPLLEVKIERESRSISANKPQLIACRAVGSSPPPRISWWKAGSGLQIAQQTVWQHFIKDIFLPLELVSNLLYVPLKKTVFFYLFFSWFYLMLFQPFIRYFDSLIWFKVIKFIFGLHATQFNTRRKLFRASRSISYFHVDIMVFFCSIHFIQFLLIVY